MKLLYTLLFSLTVLNLSASVNLWQKSAIRNVHVAGEQKIIPQKSNLVKLDNAGFRTLQTSIPSEESGQFIIMELPTPDGGTRSFRVFERPCMEKELADKYPSIKTYQGIAVDDPFVTAKLDYTELGFHAMVFSKEGVFFIDPYTNVNTSYYNSYYKKDYTRSTQTYSVCQTPNKTTSNNNSSGSFVEDANTLPEGVNNIVTDTKIRTFRLALACTIEYSAAVAGPTPTKALVLAAMVTSVNRVNGVYEKDLSIHMNLVAKNDTLIFITSDSYSNNNGGAMLSQNQSVINARIGSANYDIGHVFSTGGGGVAGLAVVCTSSKAQGVTGSSNPIGDGFDIDYVAHEMGHQFGGNHTFNGNTGSCSGNRESSVAYEPGSGTTIMAYAGICDANDIAPHSDDYFHRASIAEIYSYISTVSCDVETNSNNTIPTVNSYLATYYVPYKTSFEIKATAADPNGDPLNYLWEEYDLGPAGSWNASNNTTAPIFRSFLPSASGTRVFPIWDSLIRNSIKYRGEVLPEVTRDVKFRCTVKDIRNGYGTFNAPDVNLTVKSVNTGSLFRVSNFTTASTITGNTTQTITWDLGGTTGAPISCAGVDILLSLDSARTFPYTLVSNTANDGTQDVLIPNVSTINSSARIKVKGNGNIFFDLNNGWIKINQGTLAATFTMSDTAVCQGSTVTLTNTTAGSLDSVRWTINGGTPSTSTSLTTVTPVFNTVGIFNITLVAYKGGIGSPIFFRTLEVKAKPTVSFSPTTPVTCAGDSISITANYILTGTCVWSTGSNNTTIKVAPNTNTYYSVTVTNNGCSSKDSVLVKVNPNKTTVITQSICEGQSVTIGSQTFTTDGLHTVVLQTSLGCDSTVNLTLTVNPVKTTNLSQTICEGETASAGGQDFTIQGLHTVILQTSRGCDSIVNLNLTVNPKKTTSFTRTICDDDSVTVGNQTFDSPGLHSVVLQTSLGCDSTVSLTLIVNPNKTINLSQSICEGATATVGGQFFTTDGVHTVVLQTSLGCDSTIVLDLTVNPLPATSSLIIRNDSLVATGSTGVVYNWYLNGSFQASTNIPAYKPTQQGSWTVVAVSSDGCLSATSAALVITAVRNNKPQISFNILPNPAKGQFELHITSNKSEKYALSVFNLTGQLMMQQDINIQAGVNTQRFSIDDWSKGMYFISLTGSEGTATRNLVVQ